MSELGGLLELLHDAHDRIHAVEATFRDWTSVPASQRLTVDVDVAFGGLRWRGVGPWPRRAQTIRRLWLQQPERLRVELLNGETLTRIAVRDGAQWWRWDADDRTTSGKLTADPDPQLPPLLDPPLLSPARLLATLRLQPTGTGMRAGRDVILAYAHPRSRWHAAEGLSLELEFDARHGTILRRAVFMRERCIQLTEALVVRYDVPIDPAHFEPTVPGRIQEPGRPA